MKLVRRPSLQTIAVLLHLAEEPARWSYGYDLCRSLGLEAGTVYRSSSASQSAGTSKRLGSRMFPQVAPGDTFTDSRTGAELATELRAAARPLTAETFLKEVYRRADAFPFGRQTHEIFAGSWESCTKRKYVASTTLTEPRWANTTVLSRDLAAAIGELKAKLARELQVHGSGRLSAGCSTTTWSMRSSCSRIPW